MIRPVGEENALRRGRTGQFAIAESGGSALQPEELIRRSGKPAIIVPEAYDVRPFKEEAVVAWDGSSSAYFVDGPCPERRLRY